MIIKIETKFSIYCKFIKDESNLLLANEDWVI